MLIDLLREYDLLHSSILNGGKIKFNINYLFNGKVYVSLLALINGEEKKSSFDFEDNEEFNNFILPKIFERFISKNYGITSTRIMGNGKFGTFIIERKDSKDSLIVRNCSIDVMNLFEDLHASLNNVFNTSSKFDSTIIFEENKNHKYETYMKYNIIFDFADYRTNFFRGIFVDNYSEITPDKDEVDDTEQLLTLNIARYAYTFENLDNKNIWKEIKDSYKDNEKVANICDNFANIDYMADTLYSKALILAEFEKNNDLILHSNNDIVEEAKESCEKSVSFFNESYLRYWTDREKYYSSILDGIHQAICIDFIDAHDISENKSNHVEIKNKIDYSSNKDSDDDNNILSKLKKIRDEKLSFGTIINNPIEVPKNNNSIELEINREEILAGAEEQARKIIEIKKERDQLKKDAEEFAKIILKSEREHKKILEAAEEQARKIIELQKENEQLKLLAEDNARYLFERDKKLMEEEQLREVINNMPVKSQDIDKINNLLNAISSVKDLDFAVNHPTTLQELMFLEEKIATYLTTHKNIVHEENKITAIEKEEMLETRPVIELLAMIRNTYVSSHTFEKDGRHTLIYFAPIDEDTYKISLYSIKDDNEDLLMDVFFEEYQLTDNVIQELCDIFKTDTVIVASKTDNVPPDKADYLVIDNMDNAFKFMGCKKDFIEKIKNYL